jgi:hypothetical protein
MTVLTLLGYLFGSRSAIEQVAADPWAVPVGLVLVVAAALARSYRSRDLARQPWHLLLPAVAALTVALLLWAGLAAKLPSSAQAPPWPVGLRSVAALVLLTSPLAFLYALPFERLFGWPGAVRARLLTLGLVATWRVTLIVRALAVLLDDHLRLALCLVLLVVDGAALGGLILTGMMKARRGTATPMLLGVMSGIEAHAAPIREPGRDLLRRWTAIVTVLGFISLPVWIFWLDRIRGASAVRWCELVTVPATVAPTLGVWLVAGGAVGLFAVLLPWSQRQPRLRGRVEALLLGGREQEALRLMSAHERANFPPDWIPPPEDHFRDPPRLIDLVEAVLREPQADWVRALYLERFRVYLDDPLWYWYYDDELERVTAILKALPDGPVLARQVLQKIPEFEKLVKAFRILYDPEEGTEGETDALKGLLPEAKVSERHQRLVAALEQMAAALLHSARGAGTIAESPGGRQDHVRPHSAKPS